MNAGVYEIVNKNNGLRYVGSTINFEARWKAHVGELNRGVHHSPWLQHGWSKHGQEAFDFNKLLVCGPGNVLVYEQLMLDNTEPAYNACKMAGNRLGVGHNHEARNKIKAASKAMWGSNREGMLVALERAKSKLVAKHQDPEFKARHQNSVRRARQAGAKTITYNGETKPVREWADALGVNASTLHARLSKGWTDEQAITTPINDIRSPEFFAKRRDKRGHPTYEYKGKTLGLTELAMALGTNKGLLWHAIQKKGVEAAVAYYEAKKAGSKPKTLRSVVCEYDGAPQSLLTLSERLGAPYVTFNRRVKRHGLEETIKHYEAKHG